jgi:hypothetical protein
MNHQEPEDRPFLQRPIRSLLDISIGTALKAYALWVIGGFVIAAILALVLFGAVGGGDGAAGTRSESVEIVAGQGKPITLAQYRAVKQGTAKSVVVARLGRPATTEDPTQIPTPKELRDDCIGYERAGGNGELFFFCFSDGKLARKHTL